MACCPASFGFRMQDQLLDPPVQKLGDIKLILRRASDLVDPAELLELFSCLAQDAEHLSIERHLVDAAGKRVGAVEHLIGRRGDAKRPGRAGRKSQRGAVACETAVRRAGLRSDSWAGPRVVERNSDLDGSNQVPVAVKHLNSTVAAIGDVDVALGVSLNRMQDPELPRPRAELSP